MGSWALLLTCALVVLDQVRRNSAAGAAALILLPGAWLVHVDHIFSPRGVLGMLLVGAGTAAVALVDATRRKS